MGSRLDDPQLVFGYRSAELRGQASAPATLRVGEQVADLGDGQRRDDQAGPVLPQELGAAAVVAVSDVERGDQRPRITQDHADAAPPASSRSA